MQSVTIKELHHHTGNVLKRVEQGTSLLVTRNGRVVARLTPATEGKTATWDEIMSEVWEVQEQVKAHELRPNPVLAERVRRRH